jgi:hypothetical protein
MMKRFLILLLALIAGHVSQSALARPLAARPGPQDANEKPGAVKNIVGEVVGVDRGAGTLTVKTDHGTTVEVKAADNTVCLRLPAGETTLARAAPIQLDNIGVGDRVLGRGLMREGENRLLAQRLIALSRLDIEKKRERDLDEWRRRGVAGVVRGVNSQTGDIDLEAHGQSGVKRVVVAAANSSFRRYSPDSADFADTRPSGLGELKVGDQLRALGERSTDGASFKAEQIVSGSFQTVGYVVTEVDPERREIKAQTLDQKQQVLIRVGKESALHRIPPQLGAVIAKAILGGRPAGTTPAAVGERKATPASAPDQLQDLQRKIEALPGIALADVKKGDVMAVVSGAQSDKSHLTAIKLFAGVDAILDGLKPPPGKRQTIALSAGLPAGVFDFSLGPP